MSRTLMALVLKFIMTLLFSWVAFGFVDGNPLGFIFTAAVLGTGLNYVLGDLFVLPRFGNIAASAGDGVMGALTALVVASFSTAYRTSFFSLVLFAVLIAAGEYFFHQYLLRSKKVAP